GRTGRHLGRVRPRRGTPVALAARAAGSSRTSPFPAGPRGAGGAGGARGRMNAVELVRIARRHGIAIVADPGDPQNAGYVITRVEPGGGADLRGLPEHPEVAESKPGFPGPPGGRRGPLAAGPVAA